MKRALFNFTQSFDYDFSRDGGAVGSQFSAGITLPINAQVKALWLICTKTTTTTQLQVGSATDASAIWDSDTPIVIAAGTCNEQLQGTGKPFSGPVYLTIASGAITTGKFTIQLDYTILN